MQFKLQNFFNFSFAGMESFNVRAKRVCAVLVLWIVSFSCPGQNASGGSVQFVVTAPPSFHTHKADLSQSKRHQSFTVFCELTARGKKTSLTKSTEQTDQHFEAECRSVHILFFTESPKLPTHQLPGYFLCAVMFKTAVKCHGNPAAMPKT